MKKDLRTIRTTRAIKSAFIELLQEKTFTKVTVSEIAKKAFIDRQTFYLHYTDKYDLLAKLNQEIVKQFKEILNERLQDGPALTKLEYIYQRHASYFRTNHLEINSLLKIDTGDICLEKDLRKVFIDQYQTETHRRLTHFQADIMATLYIQTLRLFLDEERELNISEVRDLLKMLNEFIN